MNQRPKRLLLLAAVVIPATAFMFGGWAVVTVRDIPEYAVAGKPIDFVYEIRRHGHELTSDFATSLTATSGTMSVSAPGVSIGEGRYRASLMLPNVGEWTPQVKMPLALGGFMAPIKVIAQGAPAPAALPPAARGKQLFIGKGCVSCHTHQLTKDYASAKVGPDLSEPKLMASYLEKFLADPSIKKDWKTDARMPNLGLKPAEITSLIAFINNPRTASR